MLTYFWGFSSTEIFYWVALVVVSALLGFLLRPWASQRWGKKPAAIRLGIIAFTVQPLPVLLRLLGWMPENNDPMLFPILAIVNTIDLAFIIAMQAILFSMLADLVEHSEVRTGRRSEGVFYSALTFIRKTNQGIGTFIAGLMLSAVSFPQGGAPAEVPTESVMQLGAAGVIAVAPLGRDARGSAVLSDSTGNSISPILLRSAREASARVVSGGDSVRGFGRPLLSWHTHCH